MKKLIFIPVIMTMLLGSCTTSVPVSTTEPLPAVTTAPTRNPSKSYEELDSKGVGWGFVRNKGTEPQIGDKERSILEENGGYYIDHRDDKRLYLTFDEGYENGYTSKILDVLAQKEVTAAFFVTGPYLESQPELIERMIDDGHVVGNHTVNHLNLPNQPVATVRSELNKLRTKCEELYGYKMEYMRPPEGEYSERVLAIAQAEGYRTIMWSMAYKDWDINMQKGKDHAYSQVVPYLHNGAIILLHAVSSDNAEALGDIIDSARELGYEFYSLTDLAK